MIPDTLVYIRKVVWLPFGQRMFQVFVLENGSVVKAICYNEFLNKSFVINNLTDFKLADSSENIPTSIEEYLKLEAYL
ncbi:hypothetical protein [Leptospira vanthielii]|uniref:Uncharacterized protein n=1 Tax=Leptospira vanthielii TaxID=293085 RepID=A0ABY2NSM6_9LEPT|nr:hypothetical protein [Leptospira vanthielii]TGM60647.1 hypothetical protein EHQ95_01870 [Leptospira vanthielii]